MFISCQPDDISEEYLGEDFKDSDTTLTVNNLYAQELKDKPELLREVNRINNDTGNKLTTRSKNDSNSNNNKSPIRANRALEIINGQNKTYTFKLTPKPGQESSPQLYNIVFLKQEDGSFRSLGVTYDFTAEQAETFRKTKQLKGEVHVELNLKVASSDG